MMTMAELGHLAIAEAKKRPYPRCNEPVIYRTPLGLVRVTYGNSVKAIVNADRAGVDLSPVYLAEWIQDEFADLPVAEPSPRCPHCGSDRITVGYAGQPATSFHTVCMQCGAQGPTDRGGRTGSGVCDTTSCIQSAYALWAKRADTEPKKGESDV